MVLDLYAIIALMVSNPTLKAHLHKANSNLLQYLRESQAMIFMGLITINPLLTIYRLTFSLTIINQINIFIFEIMFLTKYNYA